MTRKIRTEIPQDIAAEVLFAADRTCCVCRSRAKTVQIHHLDDDPSNNSSSNLATLCFDCHRETQIRGGFDRKLDAAQIRLYKSDWELRVLQNRSGGEGKAQPPTHTIALRYMQLREDSEDLLYTAEAEYPQISCGDSTAELEINVAIASFITRAVQRFRYASTKSADGKLRLKEQGRASAIDGLWITYKISLFGTRAASFVFDVSQYGAGAAHPNHGTQVLNFLLRPPLELSTSDIFKDCRTAVQKLSSLCIADVKKQKSQRYVDDVPEGGEDWVVRGAAPEAQNYQNISLTNGGITVHFDPYQVDCYAAGKYEVQIPSYELKGLLQSDVASACGWFP